jgi:hypothetical protein
LCLAAWRRRLLLLLLVLLLSCGGGCRTGSTGSAQLPARCV